VRTAFIVGSRVLTLLSTQTPPILTCLRMIRNGIFSTLFFF
jgi:hypothetical protein